MFPWYQTRPFGCVLSSPHPHLSTRHPHMGGQNGCAIILPFAMPTSSKEIVLDIETQNTFEEVGGWFHDRLSISLVGAYFYETDEYATYLEPDLPKLWPRLERADRIIGYNQKSFDNQVMNNYYAGDLNRLPQLDLLEQLQLSLGYRVKLDDVAHATLGMGKTGHGLQAVEFWKEGKIKELADYCLQDVRITKEVY